VYVVIQYHQKAARDSTAQRPRKRFESAGALTKRGTFVSDQDQTIRCLRAERKCLKIWSLYSVGNGLYRVFTTAKRALSFQQKRVFIQEILFSFFKWSTLAQKIGHFFHLSEGEHMPPLPPPLPVPRPLQQPENTSQTSTFRNSNEGTWKFYLYFSGSWNPVIPQISVANIRFNHFSPKYIPTRSWSNA
jgi:hypothetical protein